MDMVISSPYEPGRDPLSPNRNLSPITTEIDEHSRLSVGGCLLSELAERYATPLYVLDEASLRAACQAYREALQRHYPGRSQPVYASKANSSLMMSSLVASEGFGLDAVSAGELLTALQGGVANDQIVFHGNNKSDQELLLAYDNGVTIVIDNQHDLDRLAELVPDEAEPA
ncbi:MAG: diaminopimelate decarboxylase, partial [Prochlorococcus sp.]|nr:diaminopimelate decarboxylase [Prochlorococcus sp.]